MARMRATLRMTTRTTHESNCGAYGRAARMAARRTPPGLHDVARRRLSASAIVEKDWYFTHKAWNAYIKAIIGNRGRKGKKRQQYVNDTTCGFLNVQGMGDNVFRRYGSTCSLLSTVPKEIPYLCGGGDVVPWTGEGERVGKRLEGVGRGGLGVGPPRSGRQPIRIQRGRGIGIFFANCLGEVVEKSEQIVRDPQGRFLAISCLDLHAPRPTDINRRSACGQQ